jgi:hypothetical protein
VDFIQPDKLGPNFRDASRDPGEIQPAIRAFAAVDVEGGDSERIAG